MMKFLVILFLIKYNKIMDFFVYVAVNIFFFSLCLFSLFYISRFTCDNCRAFIIETRIHCNECSDFDLCLGCYNSEQFPET